MSEEKIDQQFRLNEINEKRNYFLEEIKQNKLIRSPKMYIRF